MRFVDEVDIDVAAGNGGAGCVSFRREKFIPKGGPDGGDGGRGGHVVVTASRRKNTLLELYLRKHLKAKNGQPGMGSDRHGKDGADVTVEVPVGTVIKDETGHLLVDLNHEGARFVLARGGRGGFGNKHFATSTNRTPRFAQPGEDGECGLRVLELRSMADVGLVGMPNAGKSTLLSRVSNAHPKVADYPFTTLAPMLGHVAVDDTDGFVMADIPGLIAGAHAGKGLGDRFLRHIERTRMLMHLVDAADPEGRSIVEQVREVENELKQYGSSVWRKPRLLVINKIDALHNQLLEKAKQEAKALQLSTFFISAVSGEGVKTLMQQAFRQLQAMREQAA